MSIEKPYQPSKKEVENTELMMTEKQSEQSKERAETFKAGARRREKKEQEKNILLGEQLLRALGDDKDNWNSVRVFFDYDYYEGDILGVDFGKVIIKRRNSGDGGVSLDMNEVSSVCKVLPSNGRGRQDGREIWRRK